MPTLLVFDWDGTICDSAALIVASIQGAVRDLGGTPPSDEQARYVIGLGLNEALPLVAPDIPASRYPELARYYRQYYFEKANELQLFDGIFDLIHELRNQGFLLAIATGKSRIGLNLALEQSHLQSQFHSTWTADEAKGKPDPEMLHRIMNHLDVLPHQTLMIGDTTHDLLMAHHAGCRGVGVSWGAHAIPVLQTAPSNFLAHQVSDLRHWLLSHSHGSS